MASKTVSADVCLGPRLQLIPTIIAFLVHSDQSKASPRSQVLARAAAGNALAGAAARAWPWLREDGVKGLHTQMDPSNGTKRAMDKRELQCSYGVLWTMFN